VRAAFMTSPSPIHRSNYQSSGRHRGCIEGPDIGISSTTLLPGGEGDKGSDRSGMLDRPLSHYSKLNVTIKPKRWPRGSAPSKK
jgi:hypothetical protein